MQTTRDICAEWAGCTRCPLRAEHTGSVTAGYGPPNAKFFLVYDAASMFDAGDGLPLSSPDDLILRTVLEDGGIAPERIYISPLVACPPTVVVPETQTSKATVKARLPKAQEIAACQKRLHDLIYAVDPRLIFAAGMLSWKTLVPATSRKFDTNFGKIAGKLYDAYVPGQNGPVRYPVMPILFTTDLHKNPNPAPHGPLGVTLAAVKRAKEYVAFLEANR